MSKLVRAIGVNDLRGQVNTIKDGAAVYRRWSGMLNRCYSVNYHVVHPTYAGCSVADEWLVFSNFYDWMVQQQWGGKHLDKDLLIPGNKLYAPDRCVFVDPTINSFLLDASRMRGDYPLGVSWIPNRKEFMVKCSNPLTRKQETVGYAKDALSAHKMWRERKHHHACMLADTQSDHRVIEALRSRFAEVAA